MNDSQIIAFEKFKKLKVGALFMQMGTGKTKVAIELVDYNDCNLLLYVAPKTVLNNIEEEFHKWELKTPYKLVGYESIASSDKVYVNLLNELEGKKVFIVADESIYIKNNNTKRFDRMCMIRKKCEYALILNGTPITKNEWDLYNQMYFLSPAIINMNRMDFQKNFFRKIECKKRNQPPKIFYKFSEINADYLQKLVDPYIFSCKLDFDKKEHHYSNYIEYKGTDYELTKIKFLELYEKNYDSEVIMRMVSSLNQISSCYELKNDAVVEYVIGKRIIVFCQFLEELNYISEKMDCYVIQGSTKMEDRNCILENFKKNNKPLIMTLGTGSYSLNLQFCDEIVYSSLSFDFGKVEQSRYRIKRLGQEQDIKYTYFKTKVGVSDLLDENLSRKQTLEKLIKQKIKEGKEKEFMKNL